MCGMKFDYSKPNSEMSSKPPEKAKGRSKKAKVKTRAFH
jgi:hypothetical protein